MRYCGWKRYVCLLAAALLPAVFGASCDGGSTKTQATTPTPTDATDEASLTPEQATPSQPTTPTAPLGSELPYFVWAKERGTERAGTTFEPGDHPLLWLEGCGPFQLDSSHMAHMGTKTTIYNEDGVVMHELGGSQPMKLDPGYPHFSFGMKVQTNEAWAEGDYLVRVSISDLAAETNWVVEHPFRLK